MGTTQQCYELGDMLAIYRKDEQEHMGLVIVPKVCGDAFAEKRAAIENLVQCKFAGETYMDAYAQGVTMRNGASTQQLRYREQKVSQDATHTLITTILEDAQGRKAVHELYWDADRPYVTMQVRLENHSKEPVQIESLQSFSLCGISPYTEGDGEETLEIYRMRSAWSREGKVEHCTAEDLQLENSWANHGVRVCRYGEVGSLPVNGFFPFGAVYDSANQVFWGAQLAHNASWQMEFYRKDAGLSFSGGLADREFGHWMKTLAPEESFTTPLAILSTMKQEHGKSQEESFDLFCQRLTAYGYDQFLQKPACEQTLPMLFNEYCTTWGDPSEEKITGILEAIQNKGFSYFVIDCGWYKQDGIPWDQGMGDYEVSEALFPHGLEAVVEKIRQSGMQAGIWFEIENVARYAKAYREEEHLLKRDGAVLTTFARRFWDMNDPWVEAYLTKKVIGTLQTYGFTYMKVDDNDTIGIGCDGAESLGEGLRKNMEATVRFFKKVSASIPGIVLENCASGGHRLEPLMMSLCSMASFSDAHECVEIPIIAANLHRLITPAQSQIWAVIRENDTTDRIRYSLCATLLGRLCMSGDVTQLKKAQWEVIEEGLRFYQKSAQMIRDGKSVIYTSNMRSIRHPKGWQVVVRESAEGILVVAHVFANAPKESIKIPLPGNYRITDSYFGSGEQASIEGEMLSLSMPNDFRALALHLHPQPAEKR
ncbi:MAG: alpha-galactosidase [Lachnospiraceae bacterium]|nr:alpha-galactosidase [Lachnospiraceae bacterium]